MTRRNRLLAGAVVAIVGLLGWAVFVVLGRQGSVTDSPLIGKAAPAVVLQALDGSTSLQLAPPGKVSVINFWAPWCVPCRGEHQMLNQAVGLWSPDKVNFVGVTFQSSAGDASTFLDTVGRNVPTASDSDGTAAIDFGVVGVPETFFVDAGGVVRARVTGPVSKAQLTKIVTRLLAGQPAEG